MAKPDDPANLTIQNCSEGHFTSYSLIKPDDPEEIAKNESSGGHFGPTSIPRKVDFQITGNRTFGLLPYESIRNYRHFCAIGCFGAEEFHSQARSSRFSHTQFSPSQDEFWTHIYGGTWMFGISEYTESFRRPVRTFLVKREHECGIDQYMKHVREVFLVSELWLAKKVP